MYARVCVLLQPERINPMTTGGKYDQRSDVWSFGITMVSMKFNPVWFGFQG